MYSDIPECALAAFNQAKSAFGTEFVTPGLKPEVYGAVCLVHDFHDSSGVINRVMLLKVGQVLPHTHGFIYEKFKVCWQSEDAKAYMVSEKSFTHLRLEMEFAAMPGQLHGFVVASGYVVVTVAVENFDPEDINYQEALPQEWRMSEYAA